MESTTAVKTLFILSVLFYEISALPTNAKTIEPENNLLHAVFSESLNQRTMPGNVPLVQPLCLAQLRNYQNAVKRQEGWALHAFRTQGKLDSPVGVVARGDASACVRYASQIKNSPHAFSFCYVSWENHPRTVGVCVTSPCTARDLKQVIHSGYPQRGKPVVSCTNRGASRHIKVALIDDQEMPWRLLDKGFLAFVILLLLLNVLGSVAPVPALWAQQLKQLAVLPCAWLWRCGRGLPAALASPRRHLAPPGCGCWQDEAQEDNDTGKLPTRQVTAGGRLLQCFSLRENWSEFWQPATGDIAAFHGLKVIAMTSIVCLHTFLREQPVIDRTESYGKFHGSTFGQIVYKSGITVEIFFVISGFLAFQSSWRILSRPNGGRVICNFLRVLRKRYCRLAPVYIFVVLLTIVLLPHLLLKNKTNATFMATQCSTLLWYHVTFTYNIILTIYGWSVGGCLANTWYISADLQLHAAAFLLAALAARYPRWKGGVFFAAFFSSWAFVFGYRVFVVPYYTPWRTYALMEHVPVYLMGCLLALKHQTGSGEKPPAVPKKPTVVLYIAVSLCLAIPVLVETRRTTSLPSLAYQTSFRILFAFGVVMILHTVLCSKGWLSACLGSPVWHVPSRLSYSIYIISYLIQEIYVKSLSVQLVWRPIDVVVHTGGFLLLSLPPALLLHLLLERPAARLYTALFEHSAQSTTLWKV